MSETESEQQWFAEEEPESRAGEMVVRHIEDELRRLVITIDEKELQVVQYCGLLFRHPFDDGFIYFGPWQDVKECPGITRCLATKNTEPDLRSGVDVVFDHDDHADIQFKLASAEVEYPDDGLRADGGTKYGDKLPEGGTADLYADDEGNGASWREETSAVSIEIDVQLHDDGYQTDRKWTVHCTERLEEDTVIAGWGVEHRNKGNYWRRGDRWDDAVDFADLPFPIRRRVAAVLNRSLDEITPEHRTVHREDGMGMADEAGDRDE